MLTEVITEEIRADQLRKSVDDAIETLLKDLSQGHTKEYVELLKFWARFHRYSHANVHLIMAHTGVDKALDHYQTESDYKFSVYALWWMRMEIHRALGLPSDNDW